MRLNEPISTVKLAAGDIGIGWLQLSEHHGGIFSGQPSGDVGQEGVFDAQSKGAATHHHVMDAVLMDPGGADEAVLCESVLGLENVESAAGDEVAMALLQGIARARGVELVGLVEKLEHTAHVQILRLVENREQDTKDFFGRSNLG